MKQIGILSDTHGLWDERYSEYFKDCDEVWHVGDIGDADIIKRLRQLVPVVHAVYGNIDGQDIRWQCNEIERFKCEDVSVWMKHISGYPGRWAPTVRGILATERPGLVVGGHSHILKVVYDKDLNLLHINPGAAGRQGWQSARTLVRIKIDGSDIKDCEVIELGDQSKSLFL